MADANRSSPGPAPGSGPDGTDTARGGDLGERAIAATGSAFSRLAAWIGRFLRESLQAPRHWDFEQRVAAVGALLLIVSTFGPFSFVEAAIVLVALAILLLLKKRADGRRFHLPFGDGAVIMAGGGWSALLIVIRLFDRPLGQNLLALVCAAILVLAGLRMRLKRPIDDLPQERAGGAQFVESGGADAGEVEIEFADPSDTAETAALSRDDSRTAPLPGREDTAVRRQATPGARRAPAPPPPPPPPPAAGDRPDPDFDLPAPEDPPEAPGPFRTRPARPSDE